MEYGCIYVDDFVVSETLKNICLRKQVTMKTYGKVLLGTALMAVSVNLIYTPMSMVTGGVAGIGILFHHFWGIPVGLTNWAINVPLLILSGIRKGKEFIGKTIFAVFCFSLLLLLIPVVNVTQGDFWMSALLGGVISVPVLDWYFGVILLLEEVIWRQRFLRIGIGNIVYLNI